MRPCYRSTVCTVYHYRMDIWRCVIFEELALEVLKLVRDFAAGGLVRRQVWLFSVRHARKTA